MPRYGLEPTAHLNRRNAGAVSIAELMIVLAISSILLVAVMQGQAFVTRLAQRFMDGAALETESRLVLQTVRADISESESLTDLAGTHWRLQTWPGGTIQYRFADSTVWRDSTRIVKERFTVREFKLELDTSLISSNGQSEGGDGSKHASICARIRVKITMAHKGRRLDFDNLFPLFRRAPGT